MIARLLRRLKQRLAPPRAGIQPMPAEEQRQADELRRRRNARRERQS